MEMDDKKFKEDVSKRFVRKDYRPELVIAAHREGQVLFVKSKSKTPVWNLPQEGVKREESIRDAFLRGWAEELRSIKVKELPSKEWKAIKNFIAKKFFSKKRKDDYRVYYAKEAATPGRSREKFKLGKKYYYVEAEYTGEDKDIKDHYSSDEILDFEWVNFVEARLLMISSGVTRDKRVITETALEELKERRLLID